MIIDIEKIVYDIRPEEIINVTLLMNIVQKSLDSKAPGFWASKCNFDDGCWHCFMRKHHTTPVEETDQNIDEMEIFYEVSDEITRDTGVNVEVCRC